MKKSKKTLFFKVFLSFVLLYGLFFIFSQIHYQTINYYQNNISEQSYHDENVLYRTNPINGFTQLEDGKNNYLLTQKYQNNQTSYGIVKLNELNKPIWEWYIPLIDYGDVENQTTYNYTTSIALGKDNKTIYVLCGISKIYAAIEHYLIKKENFLSDSKSNLWKHLWTVKVYRLELDNNDNIFKENCLVFSLNKIMYVSQNGQNNLNLFGFENFANWKSTTLETVNSYFDYLTFGQIFTVINGIDEKTQNTIERVIMLPGVISYDPVIGNVPFKNSEAGVNWTYTKNNIFNPKFKDLADLYPTLSGIISFHKNDCDWEKEIINFGMRNYLFAMEWTENFNNIYLASLNTFCNLSEISFNKFRYICIGTYYKHKKNQCLLVLNTNCIKNCKLIVHPKNHNRMLTNIVCFWLDVKSFINNSYVNFFDLNIHANFVSKSEHTIMYNNCSHYGGAFFYHKRILQEHGNDYDWKDILIIVCGFYDDLAKKFKNTLIVTAEDFEDNKIIYSGNKQVKFHEQFFIKQLIVAFSDIKPIVFVNGFTSDGHQQYLMLSLNSHFLTLHRTDNIVSLGKLDLAMLLHSFPINERKLIYSFFTNQLINALLQMDNEVSETKKYYQQTITGYGINQKAIALDNNKHLFENMFYHKNYLSCLNEINRAGINLGYVEFFNAHELNEKKLLQQTLTNLTDKDVIIFANFAHVNPAFVNANLLRTKIIEKDLLNNVLKIIAQVYCNNTWVNLPQKDGVNYAYTYDNVFISPSSFYWELMIWLIVGIVSFLLLTWLIVWIILKISRKRLETNLEKTRMILSKINRAQEMMYKHRQPGSMSNQYPSLAEKNPKYLPKKRDHEK